MNSRNLFFCQISNPDLYHILKFLTPKEKKHLRHTCSAFLGRIPLVVPFFIDPVRDFKQLSRDILWISGAPGNNIIYLKLSPQFDDDKKYIASITKGLKKLYLSSGKMRFLGMYKKGCTRLHYNSIGHCNVMVYLSPPNLSTLNTPTMQICNLEG